MTLPQTLEQATIPPLVLEVVEKLTAAGHAAYLVGGCVRDMVRGKAPKDFDLATSARPEQVQQVFNKVIPTGIQHGTVTVVLKGQHVEVTTFRAEGDYVDGRRPQSVTFHTDIEADLSRRDFTINAMAYEPHARQLVDPFGGLYDLQRRLVRCVRDPMERFTEDGLRAMRAVRFATVLDFDIDPPTEAAIGPTVPIFKKVAMERIRDELEKLLLSPHVAKGVALLERTGLQTAIVPELSHPDAQAVANAPAALVPRLAVWLWSAQPFEPALARLKLSTKQLEQVRHALTHRELPSADASDADVRRFLARVGASEAPLLFDIAQAVGTDVASRRAQVERVLAENPPLTAKALALDGKALMDALNAKPGPIVGQATRYLLEQVIEAPKLNTPDGLRDLLKQWRPPEP